MGIRHLSNSKERLPTPKPNGPRCSPMSCRSRRSRSFTIEATRVPARPPSLAPTPSDETRHTSYLLLYGHQFAILRVGLSRRLRSNQLLKSRNLKRRIRAFDLATTRFRTEPLAKNRELSCNSYEKSNGFGSPAHTHTSHCEGESDDKVS